MNLFPQKYTLLANDRIVVKVKGEELAEMSKWTPEEWAALFAQIRDAALRIETTSKIGASVIKVSRFSRTRGVLDFPHTRGKEAAE
jgi:hypothetical protein